jgi:enediyne biosynthesis protein E4
MARTGPRAAPWATDAIDYDRSGRPSLLVGNFSNQMLALYHNEGSGLFMDDAPSSPVGRASLYSLTFGAFFFDYDLDGYPDIFAANGHIEDQIGRVQPKISYAEPPLLFRNLGNKRFENVSSKVGRHLPSRWWRAARPMPISTMTAIWTC